VQSGHLLREILKLTRCTWDTAGTRPVVRENFLRILACGTSDLGCEVYASETEEKRVNHTCKSRFCPSCGFRATLQWLEQQEAALPDIAYTGIVLTMPGTLWPIFQQNRHLLHDLPSLGASVIQQWAAATYGVRLLVMVVPHTFGGDLKFNAHLHILVSSGGLDEFRGKWIPRLLFKKDALMRMWRYAVISHLRRALDAQVLKSELNAQKLKSVFTDAYERPPRWIIHVDPIVSKSHFVRYAARYVRRPPIAQRRLLEVSNHEVLFLAKDTRTKTLVATKCSPGQFIDLLGQHFPDRYRHGIRRFGLLAPRTKGSVWDSVLLNLGEKRRPQPQRLRWRDSLIKYFGVDPLLDSCGQTMDWVRREGPVKS
jgi:hypothetical protein